MNKLTTLERVTIYFRVTPFLAGEVFFLVGTFCLTAIIARSYAFALFGIAMMIVGGALIRKKIMTIRLANEVLQPGFCTEGYLARVESSNQKINGRRVKIYYYSFSVEGKSHEHEFRSAYHRGLEKGERRKVYYLPENPAKSFIPSLYLNHGKWK